jgi:trk system potassium uptake protein TrkA
MMLDEDVSVSNIKFLTTANADVAEFTAQQGSKVTRKKVFELGLPNGVTIGGLVRNGVGQLVSGGTQIEAGDNVVVFCHNINMSKIEKFFK